jgi:hypothetical protein
MACITVAWLVMVVFFPHTDIDSAIGVILLAALGGLPLGGGAWWVARRRR